jgi:hypothetical protein
MNVFFVPESRHFQIGQIVNTPSFVDCFGNTIPERKGFVVMAIRAMANQDLPYYRIDARKGFEQVEGAEGFFVSAEERV